MGPRTHRALSPRLCGTPRLLAAGNAEVELETIDEMRADEQALVHGGFVFGLADHAAMLAIDEPNVVLGSAEVRFLAPVAVGDRLRASARLLAVEGKRQRVEVQVTRRVGARGSSGELDVDARSVEGEPEVAAPVAGGDADVAAREQEDERVFEGTFVCFVPSRHVLAAGRARPRGEP